MGNCLGNQRQPSPRNSRRIDSSQSQSQSGINLGSSVTSENRDTSGGSRYDPNVTVGKNQPLKKEKLRWRSQVTMTEAQLIEKRQIFWETAPAYEGKKEVWDALRAAAVAAEAGDYVLAQAIIDGVGISVPSGTLMDCYDELGTRYQVPPYCLSSPINLIMDSDTSKDESKVLVDKTGKDLNIKLRFSDSDRDTKFVVNTEESVLSIKKRVQQQLRNIEPSDQRWFFGGRALPDRARLAEYKIRPGYVIQIIMRAPKEVPSTLQS